MQKRTVSIALAFAMSLQGCVRWVAQSAPLADVVTSGQVKRIRVTRSDGSRVVVRHPAIDGAQVIGFVTDVAGEAPFSISLADVRSVSVGRISAVRTTLLIAVSTVGVLALMLAVFVLTYSPA